MQPVEDPTDVAAIKLQASVSDSRDDAFIATVADAVNALVRGLPVAQNVTDEWPGTIVLGSAMLGARLYRRRNSPSGVEALTDQGAAYVSRNDPDIAQLLQLGSYSKPAVR